jgi:hypothetical protein
MHTELNDDQQEALEELHLTCFDVSESEGGIFSLGDHLKPAIAEAKEAASHLGIPEIYIIEVLNRFST